MGKLAPVPKEKSPNLHITYITRYSLKLCQLEVDEVSTEISKELVNYFRRFSQSDPLQKVKAYVTVTSYDIYMIFTVKVEIVKLAKLYGENPSSDHLVKK